MSKLDARVLAAISEPGPPETSTDGALAPSERLLVVFNELREELISTLTFMLGSRDDAQDAAQEAFLKCWRSPGSLKGVRDMKAWIFRVGFNAAKDLQRNAWRRRAKPLGPDDMMIPSSEALPSDMMDEQEMLQRLRQAIMRLRPDEKEVFLLRQNGDLTYDQIAEIRGSPVGTIKTQMRSALHKLRQQLNLA
jgi:RNA polymerase sigma-70 factor (ECF subfamily)